MTAFVTPFAPAARRHPIEQGKHGVTHYGPWRVYYEPPPIPTRAFDWHWYHEDYDGAPDGNDGRCGSESNFAAALCACDDWEDDNA